jgi:nitrogen-specific signal transduction histidine kinase
MKTIEFNPDGQSTASSKDQSRMNDIFREILPVIFHKLKNKLTPILGYTQILKSRTADDFTIERLGKIEKNAMELATMLTILKEYSQVEPAPKQPGNINHILQNLKTLLQKMAAPKKIEISLDLDPNIPNLLLHPGQMEMLLLNMTANAIMALQMKTAPKKEICLRTRLENGHIKLIVHDNGIGMREEELDNIWTPFYSTYSDHAGLGLVICEKVIANHAAACQLRSRPGEFSEFAITFPLPAKAIKKQKRIHTGQQTDKKQRRMHE